MSVANGFLPMTIEEVQQLGIEQLDFVYVTAVSYTHLTLPTNSRV